MIADPEVRASTCGGCGSELAPALLACPGCGRLVHQAALAEHAARAAAARQGGNASEELGAWRAALVLLPAESRQHEQVSAKVEELSRQVAGGGGGEATAATGRGEAGMGKAGKAGALATIGLLLWKLKAVLLLALSKGKLLLLGLSKAGTLGTMLLSLGVYWAAFGWPLALGLVLSIYVHEMGHVAALRRFGIPASAPMFLPGIGAVVRLKARLANPVEDARVGLAGPRWGLMAALVALAVHLLTGLPIWAAIARLGGWLNLFNLLPLGPLDGGRAFNAMSRGQRLLALGAIGVAFAISREGLLVLIGLVAGARAFGKGAPIAGDRPTVVEYGLLTLVLAALTMLQVPGLADG